MFPGDGVTVFVNYLTWYWYSSCPLEKQEVLLTMHSLSAPECSHFEALKGQSVKDVDFLCTGACGGYLVTGDTPVLFFSQCHLK